MTSIATKHPRAGEFHCDICGAEISRKAARIHHTCGDWKCRLEYNSQLQIRNRESREREALERRRFCEKLIRYREQCALDEAIDEPSTYVPTCVPYTSRPLVPVSEQRRAKLREYLRHLIDDAQALEPRCDEKPTSAESAVETTSQSLLPVLLGGACATCGGYCCTTGEETAHLDAKTMRRYLDAHPADSPDDIVEDYVSRVANDTYEDSCIFHAADGCTLPRRMRSDLCETFECNGLKDIQEEYLDHGQTRFFVVASHDEQISRHRFIRPDEDLIKDSPPPTSSTEPTDTF